MPRPKSGLAVQRTVNLSARTEQQLQTLAERKQRSIGWLMRTYIERVAEEEFFEA